MKYSSKRGKKFNSNKSKSSNKVVSRNKRMAKNKKDGRGRPPLTSSQRKQSDINKITNKIISLTERIKTNKVKKGGRGRPRLSAVDLLELIRQREMMGGKPLSKVNNVIKFIKQANLSDLFFQYRKLEQQLFEKRLEIEKQLVA